MTKNDCCR